MNEKFYWCPVGSIFSVQGVNELLRALASESQLPS